LEEINMLIRKQRIVVIGSANIDLVTRVGRSPLAGESMLAKGFAIHTGGKGANQAIAAARLGAEVVFGGCVGADVFGEMQRASLKSAGVDTAFLHSHKTEPTGTALIIVEDSGQNSIIVSPGANRCFTPKDVEAMEPEIADADALLLQLEIPLESVECALDLAIKHNVPSFLDTGPAQNIDDALIRKASLISPNESEAAVLCGIRISDMDSAYEAARILHRRGAREVALKLGEKGALYSGTHTLAVDAHRVNVVDTTAAGDVFHAALAIAWPQGVESALRFATAAAAISVTRAGAQPSIPNRAEVEEFLIDKFV